MSDTVDSVEQCRREIRHELEKGGGYPETLRIGSTLRFSPAGNRKPQTMHVRGFVDDRVVVRSWAFGGWAYEVLRPSWWAIHGEYVTVEQPQGGLTPRSIPTHTTEWGGIMSESNEGGPSVLAITCYVFILIIVWVGCEHLLCLEQKLSHQGEELCRCAPAWFYPDESQLHEAPVCDF